MGGCCLFVRGGKLSNANNTKKYVVVLNGHFMIFDTQQPTKKMLAQWSGFTRGGATRSERAGGMIPLF